jgi:hypothetical protein
MSQSKTQYEAPTLEVVGSFESLTQGAQGSTNNDSVFPVNPFHPFS